MNFRYRSPVGTFVIRPQGSGFFELTVGEALLDLYHCPHEAAQQVFRQATGWRPWDTLEETNSPPGLHQWESGHFA